MFRITQDPSSGSLVQCLAKHYKNDSIVSVDMDMVGVMAAYSDRIVRICCHNTDFVHISGRNRLILVMFSQALYKAL